MKTAKATVEQCSKLSIFELRRQGALSSDEHDDYLYGGGLEIPLTQTNCHFGGKRWWFVCPDCYRRVAVLYRPPYSSFFLCRHCQHLTYESIQNRRTLIESFTKRLKIHEKYQQICQSAGQKGFSERRVSQLANLMNKIRRLPPLPSSKTKNINKERMKR